MSRHAVTILITGISVGKVRLANVLLSVRGRVAVGIRAAVVVHITPCRAWSRQLSRLTGAILRRIRSAVFRQHSGTTSGVIVDGADRTADVHFAGGIHAMALTGKGLLARGRKRVFVRALVSLEAAIAESTAYPCAAMVGEAVGGHVARAAIILARFAQPLLAGKPRFTVALINA